MATRPVGSCCCGAQGLNERESAVGVEERGETKRKRGRVGREPPETAGGQRRAEVFAGGRRSGCSQK